MKSVNALTIRNQLGRVLDELDEDGEPVLVSKGRKVRAVLITHEDFERRFLDKQAEEKRRELIATIKSLRTSGRKDDASLEVLRQMREGGR